MRWLTSDRRLGGRYRLIERLGTGGMSVVWRGHDEVLGRPVAVKVLSSQLAGDARFRARLRQEAMAAARLCHPHITNVFDMGLDGDPTAPYVVMELNEGEPVSARLRREGPFPWRTAVTLVTEVASALATAHSRGIVHRDVTPANIMLTDTGAKVVDFGISALTGQRDSAPDGSLLGTPAYLAPERLGGGPVAPPADVYALGLLLYRCLTGRFPWPADSTTEALRAHLYADPEPVPALPGMPPAVADLCLACLAKQPEDRPTAADVATTLAALVGLQPVIPAVPVPGPTPARPSLNHPTIPVGPRPTLPDTAPDLLAAPSPAPSPAVLPAPSSAALPAPSSAALPAPSSAALPAPSPAASPGLSPASPAAPSSVLRSSVAPAFAVPSGLIAALSRPARHFSLFRRFEAHDKPDAPDAGPEPARGAVVLVRAGMRIARLLRVGAPQPLGGGLFRGGLFRGGSVQGGLFRGGSVQSGLVRGGSVRGGSVQSGLVRGGSVQSGLVRGGSVQSGSVRGGSVQSGSVRGGSVRGGLVRGGLVRGGLVRGGLVRGGLVRGGSLLGGLFRGGLVRGALAGPGDLGPRLSGAILAGRHRVHAAAATVVLVATIGLAWSSAREPEDAGTAQAAAAGAGPGPVVPHGTGCKVRYQVQKDTGTDFGAQLTVINTGEHALTEWRLEFAFAGGQRLTEAPKRLSQRGRKVVLRPKQGRELRPGRSATVTLAGSYRATNPLPLTFALNGHACQAEVLGAVVVPPVPTPASPAGSPSPSSSQTAVPAKKPKKPRKSPSPSPSPPPAARGTKGGFSVAI